MPRSSTPRTNPGMRVSFTLMKCSLNAPYGLYTSSITESACDSHHHVMITCKWYRERMYIALTQGSPNNDMMNVRMAVVVVSR